VRRSHIALFVGGSLLCGQACTQILDLDLRYVNDGPGGNGGSDGPGGATQSSTTSSSSGGGPSAGGGGQGGHGGQGGDGTGGSGACEVTLATASDSFEDANSKSWCLLEDHPGDEIIVETGSVRVQSTMSQWYTLNDTQHFYGPFFYREIAATEGDFAVVTKLMITNGSGPPTLQFHGGGLLVRRPNPNPGFDEDYLLLSSTNLGTGMGVKWWHTEVGFSTPQGPDTLSDDYVALAICRRAGMFNFFAYDGQADSWDGIPVGGTQVYDHRVLDAAPVLQVGLVAHAFNGGGLAEAEAQYVNFYEVTTTCLAALPPDPTAID
jgi:hypothetical protein